MVSDDRAPAARGAPSLEAGIVSGDAQQLVDFYCRAMGFTLERVLDLPQGQVHRLTNAWAAIKIFQPTAAPLKAQKDRPWNETAGFGYVALHVDDAQAQVARAQSGGATVLTPVTNHRPGAWFALIADPQGNVWEILQEDPQV